MGLIRTSISKHPAMGRCWEEQRDLLGPTGGQQLGIIPQLRSIFLVFSPSPLVDENSTFAEAKTKTSLFLVLSCNTQGAHCHGSASLSPAALSLPYLQLIRCITAGNFPSYILDRATLRAAFSEGTVAHLPTPHPHPDSASQSHSSALISPLP